MTNKILFVSYGGGHVEIVTSLFPKLRELSDTKIEILALTTAAPQLRKEKIPFSSLSDLMTQEEILEVKSIGEQLSESIWDSSSGIRYEESCAYLGVGMSELISLHGHKAAMEKYLFEGRAAFLPLNFMTAVLERISPNLVILTCNVRFERAALVAAKSLGVPTLLIDDLFGFSMLEDGKNIISPEYWPDYLIVLNKDVMLKLSTLGFPASRIFPLGQPAFYRWIDDFQSGSPPPRPSWSVGKKLITYITPARRDVLWTQLNILNKIAKHRPEWSFWIRLHPSVGADEFVKNAPTLAPNVGRTPVYSLSNQLKISDLVIVFRSTVGMLCLISGVPLVIWDDMPTNENKIPFDDFDTVLTVASSDSLEDEISDFFASRDKTKPNFKIPIGEASLSEIVKFISSLH